jgi:hypothetical protein
VRCGKEKSSEGGPMCWKYFVFTYENRTMKPAEVVLRRGRGDNGERWKE